MWPFSYPASSSSSAMWVRLWLQEEERRPQVAQSMSSPMSLGPTESSTGESSIFHRKKEKTTVNMYVKSPEIRIGTRKKWQGTTWTLVSLWEWNSFCRYLPDPQHFNETVATCAEHGARPAEFQEEGDREVFKGILCEFHCRISEKIKQASIIIFFGKCPF